MRVLLAAAVLVPLLIVQQAAAETLFFHNESSFIDETKIMHVFGEVKNDSDAAMEATITASFYDKDGALLDTQQVSPELRVINPGESSPFEARYLDAATVDKVASYELSAEGQPAEAKPAEIKILSSNSRLDVLGVYYINVMARNEGPEVAAIPIMIATLYDREGRVVAIGRALAEADSRVVDLAPGQEAGFGIVVAERLQTYKAARYSLVADSDRYVSDVVILEAAGPGATTGDDSRSGCLIATAAFGSELAPQVQKLRGFRNGVALKTVAGSSFLQVFNGWYYSFSPQVADYEREAPWLQGAVRVSIYPLLAILDLGTIVHDLLAFNSELGIVGAGVVTSSLVGALYFAPISAAVAVAGRKRHWRMKYAGYVLACAWALGITATAAGELFSAQLLMFGTALVVLSAMSTAILAVSRAVRW